MARPFAPGVAVSSICIVVTCLVASSAGALLIGQYPAAAALTDGSYCGAGMGNVPAPVSGAHLFDVPRPYNLMVAFSSHREIVSSQ